MPDLERVPKIAVQFRIVPVTPFQQNTTLLWCERTQAAVIIDPGGEADRILQKVAALELKPEYVLLTHGHFDHVGASAEVSRRLGIPIWGPHPDDAFWLEALDEQCAMFGFPPVAPSSPIVGSSPASGSRSARRPSTSCIVPAIRPGISSSSDADDKLAQVGDVLFKGSIGRTDFPRGNHRQLLDSIRERLFPLGDDVRFIPGHGPMSTLGEERRSNPFVRT
jgi:hydroxyacylglutathione hydrolase